MARARQLSLPAPRTWGGRRTGAGRKPTPGRRPGVPHRRRPPHTAAHPLHVTLRTGPAVRCLRSERVFPTVRRAFAAASHGGFRVLQFSVQDDHVHLIVEADDTRALRRAFAASPSAWRGRSTAPSAGTAACGRIAITPAH